MNHLQALAGYLRAGSLSQQLPMQSPSGRPFTGHDSSAAAAPPPAFPDAVEVDGLHVRRGGRTVLSDISLTVRRGSVTGLLGPSGCGKSTLIRAIMGVQIIESGTSTRSSTGWSRWPRHGPASVTR